ncbi:MAG TPA: PLP-dependent aminotransferase family protein [Alphaproteobacteria bacterium]|nr:PLP-dependent aminotransferase family protein [Alphaproteobacteria bacterium]
MMPASFTLRLDRSSAVPLQRQIREVLRDSIVGGALQSGTRLPSWYALAAELNVARGTVKAAYDWLAGEGLIAGRGAQGTFVTADFAGRPEAPDDPPPPDGLYPYGWGTPPLPFQLGVPALDQFPRMLWARDAARAARSLSLGAMAYPDPSGWPPLRAAIASYVAAARGVVCEPAQVFVTAGYTGALDLITRAVACRGTKCWVEDPSYFRAREALEIAGLRLAPVPVDEQGIDVAAGIAAAPDAALVLVTPSHQSPLGMAMSLPRRTALLNWAAALGAWIIEDDYYGEFRAKGHPIPALAGIDRAGRTLYVGSFSKVLMPALRLGYVIVPRPLVESFKRITSYLIPAPAPARWAGTLAKPRISAGGRGLATVQGVSGAAPSAAARAPSSLSGRSVRKCAMRWMPLASRPIRTRSPNTS